MKINHVFQKDKNGCCIACLAMVTGDDYDTVKNWFYSIRPDWSFERSGICWDDITEYLNHKGFTYQFSYRARLGKSDRTVWPLKPFAPVHIMNIIINNTNLSHSIIMTNDGTIHDPHYGSNLTLNYEMYKPNSTGWMIGIWPRH